MLRLHRVTEVTLEMPEMDPTGQSAPIRVSLTSSRLKGAPYWVIGQVWAAVTTKNSKVAKGLFIWSRLPGRLA